jgi:branched-chain amino acid transport system substrate-binding protein
MTAALERAGLPPVFHLELAPNAADLTDLASRVAGFEPDGLVIRVPRTDLRRLTDTLGAAGLEIPFFLPWIPGLDLRRFPLAYSGSVISVAPFEPARACGPFLKLVRAFVARHGEAPTPEAVYGYDAARILIDAIRSGASGRVELVDRIAKIAPFPGASGTIAWDTGGGNAAARPVLSQTVGTVTATGSGTATR